MTYICSDPYYSDTSDSTITLTWDNSPYGAIPFTSSPDDTSTTYGPEIYAQALAGDFGPVVSYANSHWYSTVDNNVWKEITYNLGDLIMSPTGVQPSNSTNSPIPAPPVKL